MECLIKDIPMHYEIQGTGRPLLMLHGFGPDHRLMQGCMEPLFQVHEGWQRIYLDLPGTGQTLGPTWLTSADQLLNVLVEFVKQVLPQQRYCIASESYGAYLARALARQETKMIEGLLYLCPVVIADSARHHVPAPVVLEQESGLWEHLTAQERAEFEPIAVIHTEETWQKTKRDVLSGLAVADQAFLERFRTSGYGFTTEMVSEQEVYDKPVLIITGRQDSIVGYEDAWMLMSNYSHATYAVLDRAGHNLQIEQGACFRPWLRSGYRVLRRVGSRKLENREQKGNPPLKSYQ